MIRHVYVFTGPDQMVMVFDENGEQIPEYQGPKAEVWDRIKADAMPETEIREDCGWRRIRGGDRCRRVEQ